MKILGISAYYHDAASALIEDGEIISAAQEERFTRKKNDPSFPVNSIKYCMDEGALQLHELDAVVYYEKPFLKFERILSDFVESAPFGIKQFIKSMPIWVKQKLFIKNEIKKELELLDEKIDWNKTKLLFSKHHLSHAASSFFTSGFSESAILTIDGVGEYSTATISTGNSNNIKIIRELNYPNSIGLFYSAFTAYLGFEVNNGEYKLMGLAPYSKKLGSKVDSLINLLKKEVIFISDNGSIELNLHYFKPLQSERLTKDDQLESLLQIPRLEKGQLFTESHIALAGAIQRITEEVVLKMALFTKELTKQENLCLAGGVALNCVANGKLEKENLFQSIFIQPASGDAGGAVGAALAAYYMYFNQTRKLSNPDSLKNSLLGPSYNEKQILRAINNSHLKYSKLSDDEKIKLTTNHLVNGKVIGWFQGRMEFGPRALGNRSILGNPLLPDTQSKINLKIKKRESFRPFAPILLEEDYRKYFGLNSLSPYMLMAHPLKDEFQINFNWGENLFESLNQKRSPFPSVTHVDYTSRIQTVTHQSNPELFALLSQFKKETGFGVLVNTSFNIKDEPIVCNPQNAIDCFLGTEMDVLIIGNFMIEK
ncbi:MAG: hypothetical protein K1X82_10335 [Bacteroidia bacterium]|nr:hypothetical protein [Bacteroidia bacterium]